MKPLLVCITFAMLLLASPANAQNLSTSPIRSISFSLPDRVAAEFAVASPITDPGDPIARDNASHNLARCLSFRQNVGDRILWGGCEPVKGFDPKTYSLTEFEPLVWLKLYASTIMFTGEYNIRQDGPLTILTMKAQFRSNLDPGDYPYPFWHSSKKWQAYLDLTDLALVFRDHKIVAAYRIAQPGTTPKTERPWDGKWQWSDSHGQDQPRVALFSYVFSPNNPHRAAVDQSYRHLEAKMRAQNCASCHAPDNQGKAKGLLLLNYPNQALAARHTLVDVLRRNEMPPEDPKNQHPAGITDSSAREELISLAKTFVKEADAAMAFESLRLAKAP